MTEKELIKKAQEQHARDGEIEIDDDAEVSSLLKNGSKTEGAYVQAWVWVSCNEEGEED